MTSWKTLVTWLCLAGLLLASCVPTPAPATPTATAALTPTETATLPATAAPTAAEITSPLVARPTDIDAFFEDTYRSLLLRDPEYMTELGMSAAWGMDNAHLTDISDAYVRETQVLEVAILDTLQTYDQSALTPEQQLSAEIYTWFLEDRIARHTFTYYDYPVNPVLDGYQNMLPYFFTEIQPVVDERSAQDYITRLAQVPTQVEQLLDGLRRRERAGIILPRYLLEWSLRDMRQLTQSAARATPFYTAFAEKVAALNGLSAAEKETLTAAAAAEIERSVLPALKTLETYLVELLDVAPTDAGAWTLPDGAAYYTYMLHHHTTTDLTAAEIHALGQQELTRIQAEVRAIFDALGYPTDESLPQLFNRVAQDGGLVYGADIFATYETLITDAEARSTPVFDLWPQTRVIVAGVPVGGFYTSPALDGSRPGAFYAGQSGVEARFYMPTLAYHEAVPGHHIQLAMAQELDLPLFRKDATFTGHIEGWALYAERLMWELGAYEDDPYGNLGRLQAEARRAARLVVDTGINALQWTPEEGITYLVENTGLPRSTAEYEVARYIVWPGQATAYMVGMVKILELRQRAQTALGDAFDLREFHNILIGNGSVPLETLERLVDDYIAAQQ